MTFNEQVNRKVVAIAGAVAVVLAAAVLNSQRAAHDRRQAAPSPTASATASPSPSAGPAGFVCATFEALGEMIEAGAPMRTPGHDSLVVTSVRCTDQEEDERASQVQIRDVSDDGRILSVLIRPEQMLHVASLSVDGERVTVIAVQAAPPLGSGLKAPGDLGSAFSFSYIFNGRTTTASAPRRVALGCAAQDLQVSVAQLPSSAVLHFRNASAKTCAIEGYPGVIATSSSEVSTPAEEVLFGPNGGIRHSGEPLVILLKPNAVASAIIDSAAETASGDLAECKTVANLQIQLPSGEPVADIRSALRVCALEIHPLVLGLTGSD